jgi:CRISPR-associated protein Cmr6
MKIPASTYTVISKPEEVQNIGLRLDKFAIQDTEGKFKHDQAPRINIDVKFLEEIQKRQQEITKKLCSESQKLDMKTASRLLVGLGIESVYETGLSFHPIYGIPYIPASGIKGAFRSYCIQTFFNKDEYKALCDSGFTFWFGSPPECEGKRLPKECQGALIFMDAFPYTIPKLELDIMNPHFGDWYEKGHPPADYMTPVPVTFLAVAADVKFCFRIGKTKSSHAGVKFREKTEIKFNNNSVSSLADITELLKKMLIEYGIGAKTAVGYGYFDEYK